MHEETLAQNEVSLRDYFDQFWGEALEAFKRMAEQHDKRKT